MAFLIYPGPQALVSGGGKTEEEADSKCPRLHPLSSLFLWGLLKPCQGTGLRMSDLQGLAVSILQSSCSSLGSYEPQSFSSSPSGMVLQAGYALP